MSDDIKYFIITFESNYLALKAEKELKKHNINLEFVPVPREISSACGVCLKLNEKTDVLSNISYETLWQVSEKPIAGSKKKEISYQQIGKVNE